MVRASETPGGVELKSDEIWLIDEEPKKSISETQREARRRNGAKSKGPVTPEGKSRSRENAITHGAYATTIPFIQRGPFKEEPNEVNDFINGVIADLDPGDSPLLQTLARDLATTMWRQRRLQKWEAAGYSSPEWMSNGLYNPDWWISLSQDDELAAERIRRISDPSLTTKNIEETLGTLFVRTRNRSPELESRVTEASTRQEFLAVLEILIESHYNGDAETAASHLERESAARRQQANVQREIDSGPAARAEMASSFTKGLIDATGRTDRDLDRALARYWKTKLEMSA